MRLIDADAMNEELFYEQAEGKDTLITCETAFDMIKAQPTVYNIDKVIEELEKELEAGNIAIDYGEFRLFEIVKQGGVSDDVCEWIYVSDKEFIKNPHTNRLFSNEPSMQNVYCNTCGKKIKVVE